MNRFSAPADRADALYLFLHAQASNEKLEPKEIVARALALTDAWQADLERRESDRLERIQSQRFDTGAPPPLDDAEPEP